jgi:hypothetical protein
MKVKMFDGLVGSGNLHWLPFVSVNQIHHSNWLLNLTENAQFVADN